MMYNPVQRMCLRDEIQYIKGAPASQMIGWVTAATGWKAGTHPELAEFQFNSELYKCSLLLSLQSEIVSNKRT